MWVSNSSPRRDWELDEAPAVRDPAHMAEIGNGDRASIGERQWRMTFQGRMAARRVVVGLELGELPFQVTGIPERDIVENSRRIVPMSRSTKGCEQGTYGTVLSSSISRIRRLACHWCASKRGS